MSTVFLGLGSNLGHRQNNISRAIELLKKEGLRVVKASSIIETDPVGGPPQGKFLNAVVKAATSLTPKELLKISNAVEKELGRERKVVNGPRTIDIDILLYDDIKIKTPELTIPHPRMFERQFVMVPLHEIAPEIRDSWLVFRNTPSYSEPPAPIRRPRKKTKK